MNLRISTGIILDPIPRTSEYFKARDYKPKYHVFYDPSQATPRIIDAPVAMDFEVVIDGTETKTE